MSSSIRLAARGWKLEDIPNAELALFLQISPGDAAARRKKLAEQHQDPAWIAQTLEALPAPALAMLHLLVDAGGMAMEHELLEAAEESFGLSEHDCKAAVSAAIARVLAVPLRTQGDRLAISLVMPAGALIAPLVADLDLYELSDAAFVAEDSPVRNPRVFLAACTATRHLDIKLTAENRPHRGATKRLAKQVGVDERELELMLGYAYDLRLLGLDDGDVLRPDVAALWEVAAGRYAWHPQISAAQAQVARGPVATAALQRSVTRELGYFNIRILDYLPGFELGRTDGVPACRAREFDGVASGHVTPSFEVVLPPESRPIDIVAVGASCEWERLDRALVARITKASIARAVAGGSKADAIVAQLASASRHPVPQNVESAIRDWAGSVVTASIATGHVVVVDPSERARIAPLLADLSARELSPGVFLVRDREVSVITRVLGRAGIMHRDLEDAASAGPASGSAKRRGSGAAGSPSSGDAASEGPSHPLASAPSPVAARIRARVGAWRRGEPFEGRRDDFLERTRALPAQPAASRSSKLPAREGTTKPSTPAHDGAGAAPGRFDRWARQMQLPIDLGDPTFAGLKGIIESLPDEDARKMLDACRTMEQLARRLARYALKETAPLTSGSSAPALPLALEWRNEDVRGRLQFAAKRGEALALALVAEVRYVTITQLIRRGTIWMVLGEDLREGESIALKLDAIEAYAELTDEMVDRLMSFEDDDGLVDVGLEPEPVERRPWRPAPGEPAPAGHVPCPCGSGERYRSCCRNVPMA